MRQNSWQKSYQNAVDTSKQQSGFQYPGFYPNGFRNQQSQNNRFPYQNGFNPAFAANNQQIGFPNRQPQNQAYKQPVGQQQIPQFYQPKMTEFTGKPQMNDAPSFGYLMYSQPAYQHVCQYYTLDRTEKQIVKPYLANSYVGMGQVSSYQIAERIYQEQEAINYWKQGKSAIDSYWAFRPFILQY